MSVVLFSSALTDTLTNCPKFADKFYSCIVVLFGTYAISAASLLWDWTGDVHFPPDVPPGHFTRPDVFPHFFAYPDISSPSLQHIRRFFTLSLSRKSLQCLTQLNFCDRRPTPDWTNSATTLLYSVSFSQNNYNNIFHLTVSLLYHRPDAQHFAPI